MILPFMCGDYVSSGGENAEGDAAWLSATPIRLSFATSASGTIVVIQSPCNPINLAVTFTDGTLRGDATTMVTGAMGCLDERSAQEDWLVRFFTSTSSIEKTNTGIHLENALGSIDVRPDD
ncbi:META domain-containing protein [Rathayibacter iranicus]|uniref:META domain-containing protein n=2 Tax=Rathayibacter iranicus TaxID=59737 RepID=A0AAD1ELI7_9MICO|nr:META domain-containing protein [Rathayibacter iranicus]AZZ54509.1 META domain-containing protein [Rathayibacter iranicus]MWV29938.1 META domain-containing protein [Rathayibacter iranicus NCPPB 2253 = VKM Ac-1602]PPI51683.1 hypothetical protein C5E09_00405 [Rathayibacter iranicus]PPI63852.1 hypothetical protein C5E08_00410 [Rathayibacter iranicus]PPI74697.1 hypothetical protein C5E01_00405 [Rathayibacter iranicus]